MRFIANMPAAEMPAQEVMPCNEVLASTYMEFSTIVRVWGWHTSGLPAQDGRPVK